MRRKRLALAAAGGALALSSALGGALSTQAMAEDAGEVTVLAPQTYQNIGTSRCLDDSDRGLRAVGCHGDTTQQWTVRAIGGVRELKNVATSRCLDDSDRGFRTVGCHGGTTQQWTVTSLGGGAIQFKSVGTGRCADDSDRGLRTVGCHGGTTQSWR
ncbi:RICIN domain-containing protein [Streptomyces sp. NPDC020747]|uniref:RICIN domain-containing protein n=1 Tax=Streptomyces sp. NPDC020747 TaxID=3365086 RepID=UPI00378DA65E